MSLTSKASRSTPPPYPSHKSSGVPWPGAAPDHRHLPSSVKTGYEISFTRYFYKPQRLRSLEEIRADILVLERETDGLLKETIGGA